MLFIAYEVAQSSATVWNERLGFRAWRVIHSMEQMLRAEENPDLIQASGYAQDNRGV
jgi:hypothetical protein